MGLIQNLTIFLKTGYTWFLERFQSRAHIIAFLCGIGSALAHPPFSLMIGLLGLSVFLLNLHSESNLKRAFGLGFTAGLAYFLVSVFWVSEAFMVEPETYGWMAPFAVVFLASIPALFWGLAATIYVWLKSSHLVQPWLWAGIFTLCEMARGMAFTGFPWNPLGAAFEAGGVMSQGSSLFGVYGLSYVLAALTGLLALGFQLRSTVRNFQNQSVRLGLCLFLGLSLYGAVRLNDVAPTGSLIIRLVQPNIAQKIKWNEDAFTEIVESYMALSQAPTTKNRRPDIIIWPEGALPAPAQSLFAENSWTAPALTQMLTEGQILIMGAYYSEPAGDSREVWRNAMLVLRKDKEWLRVEQTYAKFKLVPFGEYTPFESFLKKLGVQNLVQLGEGYSPGPRTKAQTVGDAPVFAVNLL